jgi:hypothetical protein
MTDNSVFRRDARGLFLPGASPNPSGRPKGAGEIRELAKQYVPDALAKIASLVRSDDEKVALAASQEILNRVFGRPVQAVEAETVKWDMGQLYLAALKMNAAGEAKQGAPTTIDATPSTATTLPAGSRSRGNDDTTTEW